MNKNIMSSENINEKNEIQEKEEKNEIKDSKEISEVQLNQENKEQNNNSENQESKEIDSIKLVSSKEFKTLTNAAPLIGEKIFIIDDSEFSFSIGELKDNNGISIELKEVKKKLNVYFLYEATTEKLKNELKFLVDLCSNNEEIINSLYQLFKNDKVKILKKEDKYIMELELEFSIIGLAKKYEVTLEKIEIPEPEPEPVEEDVMSCIKKINEKYIELKNELNKLKKNEGTFNDNNKINNFNNLEINSLTDEIVKKINIKDKISEALKEQEIQGNNNLNKNELENNILEKVKTLVNEIIDEKIKNNEEKEKIFSEKIEKMENEIKTQFNDINKILEKNNEEKKLENDLVNENLKKKDEEGNIIKQNIEKIEGDVKNLFNEFNQTVENLQKEKTSMNNLINENLKNKEEENTIFKQNIEKKQNEMVNIINKFDKYVKQFENQNYLEQKMNEYVPKIIKENKYNNYIVLKVNIDKNKIGSDIRLLKQHKIYTRKFNFEIDDIIIKIDDESIPIKMNNTYTNYSYETDKIYEFYWNFKKEGTYIVKIIFKNNLATCSDLFLDCTSIISIDLSHFDCSEVTNCYQMFSGCSSIKKIEFGNLDFSLVTDFRYMFNNCYELAELNISNFNTKNAIYFNYMFNGCKKLKKVDISKFNTSSCQQIDYMFNGCESILEVDMINWDMANITSINYLFYGCKNISKIKLNLNFKNASSLSKSYVFSGIPDKGEFIFKNIKFKGLYNDIPDGWDCGVINK